MTIAPKSECDDVFNTCPKRAILKNNNKQITFHHSLVFIFSSPQKYIHSKKDRNIISLPWAPNFFYWSTSFTSPIAKPIAPCRWIMHALKYVFLGTSNSTDTLTFFPWCNPKRSLNEFNNQLEILQSLGTTSWSMV